MKTAVELLDVISASPFPLSDGFARHRHELIDRFDEYLNDGATPWQLQADQIATLLVREGMVLADEDSLRDLIGEYLHMLQDESAGTLGDDEKAFLDSYLK